MGKRCLPSRPGGPAPNVSPARKGWVTKTGGQAPEVRHHTLRLFIKSEARPVPPAPPAPACRGARRGRDLPLSSQLGASFSADCESTSRMADSPARSRPCFSERASLDGAGAIHLVSGHRSQSAEIRASRDTADILHPRHAAGHHRPVASNRDGQPRWFAFDGFCERAVVSSRRSILGLKKITKLS